MKLTDLTNENLNEGPLDLLTKRGREQRRAFKTGQSTLKLTTDNLKKQFAEYLGGKGKKNFKQATGEDFANFLKTKRHQTKASIPSGPLSKNDLNNLLATASKEAIAGQGGIPQQQPAQQQQKVSSAYVQTKDAALKLNAKEKRRLIQQLEKSIKTPNKPTVVDKNFDKSQKLSSYGKVGQ